MVLDSAIDLERLSRVDAAQREALIDPLLSEWIARGDQASLRRLAESGSEVLTKERCVLNHAWAALASGDLWELQRILPERVPDFGEHDWSFAAEASLLWAHHYYYRGDLHNARTFAGLAHVGLSGARRHSLLRPTLLLQARIALHQLDSDAAEATWQQTAALAWDGVGARSWSAAIESIAHLAAGRYDHAITSAQTALAAAQSDRVGAHLFPTCLWVVLASIARDRGETNRAQDFLSSAMQQLGAFPNLPVQIEVSTLQAHVAIDQASSQIQEAIAGLMAIGTHPLAAPELQDLIDVREGHLRVRVNELTRARVLIGRIEDGPARTYLEACADAEIRPSKTLVQTSGGAFRWHRQQIEVEMLRARARHREPTSSVIHLWRALELATTSGTIRPLIDNPMAARHFSRPDLPQMIKEVSVESGSAVHAHLNRVVEVHRRHALVGPESHALTARELEVLRAVADGGDFSSIARMMVLSRWTVRGHFYSACKKLGISGREAAIVRLHQIDQCAARINPTLDSDDCA